MKWNSKGQHYDMYFIVVCTSKGPIYPRAHPLYEGQYYLEQTTAIWPLLCLCVGWDLVFDIGSMVHPVGGRRKKARGLSRIEEPVVINCILQ